MVKKCLCNAYWKVEKNKFKLLSQVEETFNWVKVCQ